MNRKKSNKYIKKYNTTKKKSERIGRLLLMHADKREGIEEGFAGEIVACIGLKESTTGDTLCDSNNVIGHPPWHGNLLADIINQAFKCLIIDNQFFHVNLD